MAGHAGQRHLRRHGRLPCSASRGDRQRIGAYRPSSLPVGARASARKRRLGENPYTLLRSANGVDFHLYKQPTVSRRVARRMALQRIGSLGEYVRLLTSNDGEINALADDILIHLTYGFFRDPECFQALRRVVFSKLQLNRRAEPVRVWVPGCSTGEEVYSIAMLLLEVLGANPNRTKIQMFGTDITEPAVERARTGIYPEAAVRGVSPGRLRRFFLKVEHGYQINKNVRGVCVFARHDLASDPPFSKVDLISCRNVLIYAGPLLQNRILTAFQYALNPGGFLFLGKSEAISAYSDIFGVEDRGHKIFSSKPKASLAPCFDWPTGDNREQSAAAPKAEPAQLGGGWLPEAEAEHVLLEQRYAPPALVIDSDLRILHFQGTTSAHIWCSPPDRPRSNFLKMIRPEFVVDLRNAITKVKRERTLIATEPVLFEHGGRGEHRAPGGFSPREKQWRETGLSRRFPRRLRRSRASRPGKPASGRAKKRIPGLNGS